MISKFLFWLSNLALTGFAAAAIVRVTLGVFSWLEMFYWLGVPFKATPEVLHYILSGQSDLFTNMMHFLWLTMHPLVHTLMQYSSAFIPVFLAVVLFTACTGIVVKLIELNTAPLLVTRSVTINHQDNR